MKQKLSNKKNNKIKSFMPKNKDIESILKNRAERYAINSQKDTLSPHAVNYILFRLGKKELYGIPYDYAKDVIQTHFLTQVPCVPSYISGVINRRGNLIAVIDLKKLFGISEINDKQNFYIIIVNKNNLTVGILADQIYGSDLYDSSLLDVPLSSEGSIKQDYIIGIHHGDTAIINIETILSSLDLQLKEKIG